MSSFADHANNPETDSEFQARDEQRARFNEARYQHELYADDQTHVRDEGDAAANWLEETGCTLAEAAAFQGMVDRKPAVKVESTQQELFPEVA
ncbi:MAG: hypothetical protein WDO73_02835 [Ignavibacteriota bacterium]